MDSAVDSYLSSLPTTDASHEPEATPTPEPEPEPAPALTLTKKQLQALLRFASKDVSRESLSQVWFQDGCAIATDGHRLAGVGPAKALRDAKKSDEGFGIKRSDLEALGKSMRAKQTIAITRDGVELTDKDGSKRDVSSLVPQVACDQSYSATFPKFEHVIPWTLLKGSGERSSGTRGFNPSYLADLAVIPTLAGFEHSAAVKFIMGYGELDPSMVIADCPDTSLVAVCVLMPMRI